MRHLWVLLTALAFSGCPSPGSMHPVVAAGREASNGAALALETAEASALALYRVDQLAAIAKVKAAGLEGEEAQKAGREAVARIRGAYAPLWQALHVAHAAHTALRDAVEAARLAEEASQKPDVAGVLAASAALAKAQQEVVFLLQGLRGAP